MYWLFARFDPRLELFAFNFVEPLRESSAWRYRFKTSSSFVLMLTDCFEYYESSVDVEFFRARFPNPRAKAERA